MKLRDSTGKSLVNREKWFPKERGNIRDNKKSLVQMAKASKLSHGRFSNRALFVHYFKCPYLYFLSYKARVKPVFNQYSEMYRLAGYIYHELMDKKFKLKWSWDQIFKMGLDQSALHPIITKMAKQNGGVFSTRIEQQIKERVMQGLILTSHSKHSRILEAGIVSESESTRVMLGADFYCRIDLLGLENGKKFILDYKLSKFKGVVDPTQLLYYSFMIPAHYGYYYYVMDDMLVKVDFSRENRRKVLETVDKVVKGILRQDYSPNKAECSKCYLKGKCNYYSKL